MRARADEELGEEGRVPSRGDECHVKRLDRHDVLATSVSRALPDLVLHEPRPVVASKGLELSSLGGFGVDLEEALERG